MVGKTELEIHQLNGEPEGGRDTEELTEQLIELRTAESDLIERLTAVVAALKAKGGDVSSVEQYLAAVTDLKNSADSVSRLAALVAAAKSWARSPEGGVLFGKRVLVALGILLVFWIMSRYAGRLVGKGLESRPEISSLLTNFAKRMAGGVTLVVGILMALAALGVSIGPLMAALGAGGFILGFALQETLASFASGLMIMIYRPFDVDDYVLVAGVEGNVIQMSLVSTTRQVKMRFDEEGISIPFPQRDVHMIAE